MKKFLPKNVLRPLGFSLVELLIVISILAILTTIGFAVYSNMGTGPKSRNNVRRADLEAIAKALEVNKTATGYVVLANTQFSNNAIPADDPSGDDYCANATASTQPANPSSDWTGGCPANYAQVSITVPAAGTAWKVCTWLEAETNPTGGNEVFCKLSSQ